ncbi:MAG: hypothetical protein ACRDZU_04150 [Acidimicrobiales bacterium]
MRRFRAVIGSAMLLGAAALGLVPDPAEAATLTQAGWWWRVNDPLIPETIPASPLVPEGGLMVAGAPDGATAIAALHFELGDDEGSPVLTLTVAENGDQGGDGAVMAACLTGSAWQPESSGAWVNKPFPACDQGSVTGVRAGDGKTWSFALAPLLSDGIVDVTLVPGRDPTLPAGLDGSTFQLVFTAPSAASLATTSGGSAAPPIELPDFGAPTPDGAGTFDPPPFGGDLALPPAASFAPSLPEADQGLTATAPVVQQRNAPLSASPADVAEDHELLGIVILALCGAALLWSAQLPTPAVRRLGSFASETATPGPHDSGQIVASSGATQETAGLGRFARERSGPAPRL